MALATEGQDYMVPIALYLKKTMALTHTIGSALALVIAVAGLNFGLSTINRRMRARNNVERIVLWGLIAASGIAILTTVGIICSMLSRPSVSSSRFPRGNSSSAPFGIRALPLPVRVDR